MKKVLMLASVASMIGQFNIPNIEILQEMGYQVDVACNFKSGSTCTDEKIAEWTQQFKKMGVQCFQIDFSRSVTDVASNMKALWQVEHLLDRNQYEFIHCHTPIGGVVARIAAKIKHTKVIYTAHGFHFYKGAPVKNWLLYYPVEKLCAHFTDVLITINQEDYALARRKMKAGKVVYVPGVGIDLEKFGGPPVDRAAKRRELGVPEDATLLLSVGELSKRKNHETAIRAIAGIEGVYYIIAGEGALREHLQNVIREGGVTERVKLLGYRKDIRELCEASDIFCFPSRREGLGIAAIEAMACGLPLVTSNVQGIKDYSENGVTGYNCAPDDVKGFADSIMMLNSDSLLRRKLGEHNRMAAKRYDVKRIIPEMKKIYFME